MLRCAFLLIFRWPCKWECLACLQSWISRLQAVGSTLKYSKLWPPYQPFPGPFNGVTMLLLITPSFDPPWHGHRLSIILRGMISIKHLQHSTTCSIDVGFASSFAWRWHGGRHSQERRQLSALRNLGYHMIPYDTMNQNGFCTQPTENHVEPLPTISGKTFTEASHGCIRVLLRGPGRLGWSVASGHQGQSPWRQPYRGFSDDANFIGSLHVPILMEPAAPKMDFGWVWKSWIVLWFSSWMIWQFSIPCHMWGLAALARMTGSRIWIACWRRGRIHRSLLLRYESIYVMPWIPHDPTINYHSCHYSINQ